MNEKCLGNRYELGKKLEKDLKKYLLDGKEDFSSEFFLKKVFRELSKSGLSQEDKNKIKDKISEFLMKCEENNYDINSDIRTQKTIIRDVSYNLGTELIKNNEKYLNIAIKKYPLSTINWEDIQTFDIVPLEHDNIAYRGGTARVIARKVLGIADNPIDNNTVSDADMLGVSFQQDDIMINNYKADPNGINYIKDFDINSIKKYFFSADLFMNQIVITKDALYISDDAIADLNRNYGRLNAFVGNTFYNKKTEQFGKYHIFYPSQIERGLKFLSEKKINTLQLPKHVFLSENLDLLEYEKTVLISVKRILSSTKSEEEKISVLYNLSLLLVELNVISDSDDLFSKVEEVSVKYKYTINSGSNKTLDFDSRYKLSKYIKIAITDIFGDKSEKEGIKDKYTFVDGEQKLILPKKTISEQFKKNYTNFRDTYFSD